MIVSPTVLRTTAVGTTGLCTTAVDTTADDISAKDSPVEEGVAGESNFPILIFVASAIGISSVPGSGVSNPPSSTVAAGLSVSFFGPPVIFMLF
ncbi:MAG: hypothetical protein WCW30_04635 [Candidatus Gracilibacteria bacterium]|jgi:hypothetical protein